MNIKSGVTNPNVNTALLFIFPWVFNLNHFSSLHSFVYLLYPKNFTFPSGFALLSSTLSFQPEGLPLASLLGRSSGNELPQVLFI